ncbi:class I SAM-dependent methyltransferase [Bdellovibrionota bacterium FG-2]
MSHKQPSKLKKWMLFPTRFHEEPNFYCSSFFSFEFQDRKYDFVYDAGLPHHIFPHRRLQYLERVANLVKRGGHLGLVTFNEKMGTQVSDRQIYNSRRMEGGMSFSPEKLEFLFAGHFRKLEFREMRNFPPAEGCFGFDFVSVSLWERI